MKKHIYASIFSAFFTSHSLYAESEPFVGEVMYVAFNFCPKGWARADGQLLPLSQNTALFALLGTQFGGNGKSNFALPNLQDRFTVGSDWNSFPVGSADGATHVTLDQSQIPQHTHRIDQNSTSANGYEKINLNQKATVLLGAQNAEERLPRNNALATSGSPLYTALDTVLKDSLTKVRVQKSEITAKTSSIGGGQPVSIRPPYLTLTACIALQGIFPPRP